MKELKKEFRWFNIMEYEKEENYLSKRHQEGWKFKRVTFLVCIHLSGVSLRK